MLKFFSALTVVLLPISSNAFAQTACTHPCASNICSSQCYLGVCDNYCVRDIFRPTALVSRTAASSQGSDLHLHFQNVTPAVAAKIRRLLEDKTAR
jgi:hypothetical protein